MSGTSWLDDYRARHWHPSHRRPLVLPERFAHACPEGIPSAELRDGVVRYLTDFDRHAAQGIAPGFYGRSGQYKTYAACCVAKYAYYVADVEVEFVNCGQRFLALEDNRFAPETAAYLERLATVPLVVLDDFTNVRALGWAMTAMVGVATARYDALRPTIYTGNASLAPDDLRKVADLYGACIARRMYHGADGFRFMIG